MRRLIDWLFKKTTAYNSTAVPNEPVVRISDLEVALEGIELPNQNLNHYKCAYRRLVEDLESEDAAENAHLEKCYNCLGYNENGTCPDYVSVEELTRFYDMFKMKEEDREKEK